MRGEKRRVTEIGHVAPTGHHGRMETGTAGGGSTAGINGETHVPSHGRAALLGQSCPEQGGVAIGRIELGRNGGCDSTPLAGFPARHVGSYHAHWSHLPRLCRCLATDLDSAAAFGQVIAAV